MVSDGGFWLDGRLRTRPKRRASLSGSSGIVGRVMVDRAILCGLRPGILGDVAKCEGVVFDEDGTLQQV